MFSKTKIIRVEVKYCVLLQTSNVGPSDDALVLRIPVKKKHALVSPRILSHDQTPVWEWVYDIELCMKVRVSKNQLPYSENSSSLYRRAIFVCIGYRQTRWWRFWASIAAFLFMVSVHSCLFILSNCYLPYISCLTYDPEVTIGLNDLMSSYGTGVCSVQVVQTHTPTIRIIHSDKVLVATTE